MSSADEYDEQLWDLHSSDALTMRISEKEELGRESMVLGREDCWREMEDEKGKMIMGYVILEWLRRLPRERMQQEEVKYLVEMVVAELKGVISQQEEAEALCQSLCSFFSWGVCLVIAFPLFPVHCNGLSLSIDILRDCHPNELKQTHQLFALARIVSHKSTASVYKLDCFAPTFSK